MNDEEFVPQASRLSIGRSVRVKHCNNNRTMLISRESNKLSAYCFRCKERGYYEERESLQEKTARLRAARAKDEQAMAVADLPEPRVYSSKEWPEKAGLWLYKAGFSPSMIKKLGAYWCPHVERVVLPVFDGKKVIFWQARSIDRKPKIISPRMPRRGVVAKYGAGDTLVLCEDALSAFKVGQVTEAWALLGTSLLPAALSDILAASKPVVVWLDGDEPGRAAAAKIIKTLRAYGVQVRNVVTEKDPKLHAKEEIKARLYDS